MATQLTEAVHLGKSIDDSEFENFNGQLTRRPVPKEEHADYQFLLVNLLDAVVKPLGGKARQEWSISDDGGHWLTPDVTVAPPDFKRAKNNHLLIPAYLVVEVRSEDQSLKDLFEKRMQYQDWGTRFYWLIDPIERACYEVLPEILPKTDILRTDLFTLKVSDVFTA